MPDSALYFVFVFGEKYVSISGVTATENKHFGEKGFENGVSYVQMVSQVTNSSTSEFEITFVLGGSERATIEQMKVFIKHGLGLQSAEFRFSLTTVFQT